MRVSKFKDFINENKDNKFNYMMLSRLQSDCEYVLGAAKGNIRHLYYNTIEEHIAEMKKLWETLPEKPEWLTYEQIEDYEKKMLEYQD